MNLLIDSGNSFIKWALTADEPLKMSGQCLTSEVTELQQKWATCDVPDRVLVSNVAGKKIAREIRKTVKTLWQIEAEFVASSSYCCGLTNSYQKPEQLGVDRWMAMLAAYNKAQCPVIVIDSGTAVTIDLVDNKGLFAGGVILPGLKLAFQSLKAGTDAVGRIDYIDGIVSPIAKSTSDGVTAGVMLGLAGSIERVISEQSSSVKENATVFISGGDAEKILPYLTIPVILQSDLVLLGLKCFIECQ